MSDTESYSRTSLFAAHQASGARIVPFAGYEMPVQYTSIMAEAKAVREDAGMFDVSHMARLRIEGPEAESFLEYVTSNDVAKIPMDGGQYSLLPNDKGGCVDDIIVYRTPQGFQVVVNAANHEKDVAWIKNRKPSSVNIFDDTDETAMIAVQGPQAVARLSTLTQSTALQDASAFTVIRATFCGFQVQAARSGYTGEDGYELICSAKEAETLWNALLNAGVTPCGLGARDTLRVEAGLPLYGHELNDDLSPIAAGLGWVIGKTKQFVGSDIVNAARQNGTPTRLVGVILNSKRLATPGIKVLVEDKPVGEVSSGVISPTLDTGIAFAFVASDVPLDTACVVETRGKPEPGKIVNKRFYRRAKA